MENTFVGGSKTVKSMNGFSLESMLLYGTILSTQLLGAHEPGYDTLQISMLLKLNFMYERRSCMFFEAYT